MLVRNPKGRIVEVPTDMWDRLKEQGGYEIINAMAATPEIRQQLKELSVIVLAWNKWNLTKRCITSILENTRTKDFEVVVINNGSTDETRQELNNWAKNDPRIVVIHNSINRGVAGGRNDGILAAKGLYLAFFDNDSTVGKGWDTICLDIMKRDRKIGFVGRLGTVFHGFTQAGMRFVEVTANTPIQVDVVSGGATVIRREVFAEVGLLDEWGMGEFWHEDSEICLRAALAGWLSFTVKFPWEHEWHASYKQEKGTAWMEKFQANLDYIKNKVRKENVITIYRDYHGEHCPESLCIVTTNLTNELRKRGWVVIRKPTKKIVPISLRICTGFVLEYAGRQYWWGHQENDIMPNAWADPLKEADYIITPSNFCADNFERSGVEKKKVVRDLVPNGIDADVFKTDLEPTVQFADTFLFFANGATQPRKGTELLLEAYFEEFTRDDDCVLLVKDGVYGNKTDSRAALDRLRSKYPNGPRVVYLFETWEREKLAKYYRRAAKNGVFINPHRAEGFGLCILEAMACGSRVITTGYGGNMDFCEGLDPRIMKLIDYKLVPSTFHNNSQEHYYLNGEKPEWAEPDKAHMRKLMRQAFEEPVEPISDVLEGMSEGVRSKYDFRGVGERFDKFFIREKAKNYGKSA